MQFPEWLEKVKQDLEVIETSYPQASPGDRTHLQEGFRQIQRLCENVLEGWASLEERVAVLLQDYPELGSEEEVVGEEFWLDKESVHRFREGQGYYQLQMFCDARPHFQVVVEKEPDFLLGRLYLALSEFQEERWDEAYRQFQLVAESSDHARFCSFAFHMMGCIHVQRSEEEAAIRFFQRALSLCPESEDSWFNMGACYYRLQEYGEAIPLFYKALQVNREDWEAMYYLSCCYKEAGQWESVYFWRTAVYEKTHNPTVMESIAQDFEEAGESERALIWYQKMTTMDPKKASAYHGMSWNLWVQGCEEQAMGLLKKSLTLDPHNQEVLFTYVWYLLKAGDFAQVERIFKRLPRSLEENTLWIMLRSQLFLRCQDYDKASEMAFFLTHREQRHGQGLGFYQLGRIQLEEGRIDEARISFQQAHQLTPHWYDPVFYEGVCHLLAGEIEGTKACWNQLPV